MEDLFQGILTSPEMCLKHAEFRKILAEDNFSKNICAVIIDEAHCISQWGGDFRKVYALLEKLRAFFPPNIPFLATSATLPPLALREVRSKLAIDPDTSFYLNLGNDRPNISMSVQQINGSDDYEALRPLLAHNVSKPEDMTKTIVFTNTVSGSQIGCKRVRQFFAKPLRKYVDSLHSHRTVRAKRRVMRRFRQGKVKILIATEAAGMVSMDRVIGIYVILTGAMLGSGHSRHQTSHPVWCTVIPFCVDTTSWSCWPLTQYQRVRHSTRGEINVPVAEKAKEERG